MVRRAPHVRLRHLELHGFGLLCGGIVERKAPVGTRPRRALACGRGLGWQGARLDDDLNGRAFERPGLRRPVHTCCAHGAVPCWSRHARRRMLQASVRASSTQARACPYDVQVARLCVGELLRRTSCPWRRAISSGCRTVYRIESTACVCDACVHRNRIERTWTAQLCAEGFVTPLRARDAALPAVRPTAADAYLRVQRCQATALHLSLRSASRGRTFELRCSCLTLSGHYRTRTLARKCSAPLYSAWASRSLLSLRARWGVRNCTRGRTAGATTDGCSSR